MNKVILIGNLTKDPELITTSNGKSICRLNVAVNRNYTNAQGEKESDFFNVVCYNTLAENCAKFLKKGQKASYVGEIQNSSYMGSDNVKKYSTQIVANEVEFLNTSQNKNENSQTQNPNDNDTSSIF